MSRTTSTPCRQYRSLAVVAEKARHDPRRESIAPHLPVRSPVGCQPVLQRHRSRQKAVNDTLTETGASKKLNIRITKPHNAGFTFAEIDRIGFQLQKTFEIAVGVVAACCAVLCSGYCFVCEYIFVINSQNMSAQCRGRPGVPSTPQPCSDPDL